MVEDVYQEQIHPNYDPTLLDYLTASDNGKLADEDNFKLKFRF